MKVIVFDTGPIISLTTNNLLGLLTNLKEKYKGSFYITGAIRRELIERPLETKKFKFEALQVIRCVGADVLEVSDSKELRNKECRRGVLLVVLVAAVTASVIGIVLALV